MHWVKVEGSGGAPVFIINGVDFAGENAKRVAIALAIRYVLFIMKSSVSNGLGL
jgi:hypothetical protein